jgi:hypothetical protein
LLVWIDVLLHEALQALLEIFHLAAEFKIHVWHEAAPLYRMRVA